jgi:hypothetical protein
MTIQYLPSGQKHNYFYCPSKSLALSQRFITKQNPLINMKKVLILIVLFSGSFLIHPSALYAQVNATTTMSPAPVQLDEKTQKKVDKAKAELAKDKEKLGKLQADYMKEQTKFEKKKSKGDLSPNDIEKGQKSLDKTNKEMAKLNKDIEKNEKYIASFNPAMPQK